MVDWLNRVCKWRSFFAGWQLGTRTSTDPESNAVRDQRELLIILRCEVTALTALLIKRRVFSQAELAGRIQEEARLLELSYEKRFPGMRASDDGLVMDIPVASETMRRMNFKP